MAMEGVYLLKGLYRLRDELFEILLQNHSSGQVEKSFHLPHQNRRPVILSNSIGILAAFLTTMAFVPQVVRVIRTRDTHAISLWMYLIFSTGLVLWLVYGMLLHLWPVILANSVTLVLTLIVIFFKLRSPD